MRTLPLSIVILLASQVLTGRSAAAGGEPATPGDEIIKASGVRAGLCVHLGAGDGELVVQLATNGRFIVHALAGDAAIAAKARKRIRQAGLYGRAAVELGSLRPLPYDRNLVNLLVIDDPAGAGDAGLTRDEILRVLRPGGVAMVRGDRGAKDGVQGALARLGFSDAKGLKLHGGWARVEKPPVEGMDSWTHFRHGADGNAVSRDTHVGVPSSIRWIDGPRWPLRHYESCFGAVTAAGRVFAIFNEAQPGVSSPNRWLLVARDAYNGTLLWKRPVTPNKSTGQTLVAEKDRVFLVIGKSLTSLDAATGEEIKRYAGAAPVSQYGYSADPGDTVRQNMVFHKGRLILRCKQPGLRCIDADSGEERWRYEPAVDHFVLGDDHVFFPDYPKGELVCLDAGSGKESWRRDFKAWSRRPEKANKARRKAGPTGPTLTSCGNGVLALGERGSGYPAPGVLHAVSAKDGKHLWDYTYALHGHGGSWKNNNFFIEDLLWVNVLGPAPSRRKTRSPAWVGLDLATGKEKKRLPYRGIGHRCHPDQATERFFFFGSMDVLDRHTGKHDFQRSGATSAAVPADLELLWQTQAADAVGGLHDHYWRSESAKDPLSSPVIAGGTVYVTTRDGHQVLALSARTGQVSWRYTAGARVDSPPTILKGLCLFGCRDGWVYCLRAADGALIWRFRAAPWERRIVAHGQIESLWPVGGSLLVMNDVVYAAAGRHSHLDGGVTVYALDPWKRKVLWQANRPAGRSRNHDTALARMMASQQSRCRVDRSAPVALGDLLVGDGVDVHLQTSRFGAKETPDDPPGRRKNFIQTRDGFLESSESHRTWWFDERIGGRLLVFDERQTIAAQPFAPVWSVYRKLFQKECRIRAKAVDPDSDWSVSLKVRVRAMLLAGDLLFAAGVPNVGNPRGKGVLCVLSRKDGGKLSELKLDAPPVFDGMAAAGGRLYLSKRDGKLACFGPAPTKQ